MTVTLQYQNQEERIKIIESNKDKYLIAEKNITEGNFLVFTDVKPIETELVETNTRLTDLELTIAEMMVF